MHLSKTEFEELVKEGMQAIPQRFLQLLENVATVVEEEPTQEQKEKLHIQKREVLFGLYEGVPQISRGPGYSGVLPDKITIFMRPILASSQTKEEATKIVQETVRHEIAHHFGMDEREVEQSELRRLAKQRSRR